MPRPARLRLALPLALALALIVPGAHAAPRTQDYLRDLVQLSGILGGAHAIRLTCNGRDDQYWRGRMMEMLEMEAGEAGPLRQAMVDAFNRGYEFEAARRSLCDADTVNAEAAYAGQGRIIAERLAESLLPKRARGRAAPAEP